MENKNCLLTWSIATIIPDDAIFSKIFNTPMDLLAVWEDIFRGNMVLTLQLEWWGLFCLHFETQYKL